MRSAIAEQYGKQYVPDAPRAYQTKQKNAQEAHEAVRPTDVTRRPRDVAKFLESDQARLYELIWRRAMASQMESAELERTTVDIAAKVGAAPARPARHRHGDQVRRLPDALPGRAGRRAGGRGRQAPARDERRRGARQARDRRHPALHRAAAALLGSLAGQAHGRARHRPALDLCVDPAGAERPQLCAAGEEAPLRRGQGPRRRGVPGKLLRPLRRIRIHRRAGRGPRPHRQQRGRLARPCCATSGATSSAPSTTSRICGSAKCSTCSTRC